MTKSFSISKTEILEAFKAVKKNKGAAGVDGQSLKDFEERLKDNLYKIWNRMSSGSYLPPPVKEVEIPKEKGVRKLGIPTVADRVAQMVVKRRIESEIDKIFHEDSYGYRPNKSAIEAVGKARERCWKTDWVLDLDIKGFFDNIDHELLMAVVKRHVEEKWMLLYIERWIKAPLETKNGETKERKKGTPQGGVISPLLANLFLHYVYDKWMESNYTRISFERYADDIICHCVSLEQAINLQDEIEKRLEECKLELNREKTRIVYCKDSHRYKDYPDTKFDFLGYEFRPRLTRGKRGFFVNFSPAVSIKAQNAMRRAMRKWKLHKRTEITLEEIAQKVNPVLRGWINYYGKYYKSALRPVLNQLNRILEKWIKRKYGKQRKEKICKWLKNHKRELFVHWNLFSNDWMMEAV
jgi:RNA-directed DNA polymerase